MKELEEYSTSHSSNEWDLLSELSRETYLKVLNPRMLSGHNQGLLLTMLVHMISPRRVLEIGTYTGYSALCIARALRDDALLHTIEIDDEIACFAQSFFNKSGFSNKINSHIGDAATIIPGLNETFQLVFIDGNKRDYVTYYNTVFESVASGGFVIADNVLWDGHVLDKNIKRNDLQTRGIVEFNAMVKEDCRVEKVMLPLRDGLTIIRKK